MGKSKTILTNLCRLILGITFIFSGYVKAIDPLGTQYKIQDYLEAIGLQGMFPDWSTLTVSVLLSTLEFCLGFFILLAIRRRLCSRIIFIFMIAMTLITLWLVVKDPIQDCGCFGDAIHLTNAQTFGKNIVLLACAAVLLRWPLRMVRFISRTNQWIAINWTILFILSSSILSLWYLPIFDFRPYHIGANIKEGMSIPKGAPQPKFKTTFILEKNGQRKEFNINNYPDSSWKFIDSKTTQISAGYIPPIHDFSIETRLTGKDITPQVLDHKGYTFLLIAPYLEHANDEDFGPINILYEYAQSHDYPFYCLTASNEKGIKRWIDLTGAEYPFCTTDGTTLKTIIRSNPGLILLKNGTIIRKWSHNELPNEGELTQPLELSKIGQTPGNSIAKKITKILLWFLIPLFLFVLADRLWAWGKWVRNKEKKDTDKINQLFKQKRKMRKKIVAGN
ncbi:MAG: BT_3928 family protein, partial [Prevotella sp.]